LGIRKGNKMDTETWVYWCYNLHIAISAYNSNGTPEFARAVRFAQRNVCKAERMLFNGKDKIG
jgi:hypothetical protein